MPTHNCGRRKESRTNRPADEYRRCRSGPKSGRHGRVDNAWFGSVDISINKAWTARAFDVSTKQLAELSQAGDQFFGIHGSNRGRAHDLCRRHSTEKRRSGCRLNRVSGGMGKQDQEVAEAGAAPF
jgi:hypothetical protein